MYVYLSSHYGSVVGVWEDGGSLPEQDVCGKMTPCVKGGHCLNVVYVKMEGHVQIHVSQYHFGSLAVWLYSDNWL